MEQSLNFAGFYSFKNWKRCKKKRNRYEAIPVL